MSRYPASVTNSFVVGYTETSSITNVTQHPLEEKSGVVRTTARHPKATGARYSLSNIRTINRATEFPTVNTSPQ